MSGLQTGGLVATVVGLAALGFFWALILFVDEETNCTAHRGSAYQECLRASDLNGVRIQAAVTGLAAFGFVVLSGDMLGRRLQRLSRPSGEDASDATARGVDDRGGSREMSRSPVLATSTNSSFPGMLVIAMLSGGLLVACLLTWIWGLQGGWVPDRPFPYEPIATSEASNTILTGLVVGASAGALVVLLGRQRSPARATDHH